jgi:hypothetical protein
VDLLVYAIIIPVVPFQLEVLGYKNVSSLSGFLLLSFVRIMNTRAVPRSTYPVLLVAWSHSL